MAESIWDDILYTDVMQSDGFIVDYAVCTTYSLDMPTLLSIPFMLGTMSDITQDTARSPHLFLEAIDRSAGKFAVFCNAGSISVPQTNSKIYSLLERSVVQIALPAKGTGFVNFHPKVWVIKETNPDEKVEQIKVVVISRNLTNSNDLDVVCELIGTIGNKQSTKKARAKHKPLTDFLLWLRDEASDGIIKKNILLICDDIQRIKEFQLNDSPFEDYDFFPMGINGYDGKSQCLDDDMLNDASEMVIISPFIDTDTLRQMTNTSPKSKKTLITRSDSLTQEILAMFPNEVYVPKDVLIDKVEKDVSVDLHEKVYFIKNHQTGYNQLYIGSTNATKNGFGRNVEFLLKLSFAKYKTSFEKFRKELINDSSDSMFEQVVSIPDNDHHKDDFSNERELRRAISAIKKAHIIKVCENCYKVTIQCPPNKIPETPIFLYPLGSEGKKSELVQQVVFDEMELTMLTEFYVIGIGEELRRVIKIDTIGMPFEEREIAIFRSYIDTEEKFISYLSFILTDDVQQFIIENQQLEQNMADKNNLPTEQVISISFYEDMVRKAYNQPERFTSIRQTIDKADKSVIPEHFAEMYATFETVIKRIMRYGQQINGFPKG